MALRIGFGHAFRRPHLARAGHETNSSRYIAAFGVTPATSAILGESAGR